MDFIQFSEQYRRCFYRTPDTAETDEAAKEEENPRAPWAEFLTDNPAARRKFKIWEETQGTCIYCGRSITAEDFVYGTNSDIEHIIPQAIGGRSVLSNLVCSCRECNRQKGFLTAMDHMLTQPSEKLQEYLKRLRYLVACGIIDRAKYAKLTMPKQLIVLEAKSPV